MRITYHKPNIKSAFILIPAVFILSALNRKFISKYMVLILAFDVIV